jgi:hypothetical protein
MRDGVPDLRSDTAGRGLDRVVGNADFSERHRRVIPASADRVWVAALAVTPQEIRLLAPFMAVRLLPAVVKRRRFSAPLVGPTPILEVFQEQGFVELQRDAGLVDGRAVAVYGAAGRFWSPAGDEPVPSTVRKRSSPMGSQGRRRRRSRSRSSTAAHTEVITETRIVATDAASRRAFALYWLLIRGPSGLIRRSWLAAIHRRATA